MIRTRHMLATGRRRAAGASYRASAARQNLAAVVTEARAQPASSATTPVAVSHIGGEGRPRDSVSGSGGSAFAPGDALRIALVDDDPVQAEELTHILTAAGHLVLSFTRPLLFQQQARRDTFDMVLLDGLMAEMNALDLLAWLRATRSPPVPVVMITARPNPADIIAAYDGGADDYMVKPISSAVLVARLKALARRTRFHTQASASVTVGGITLDPITTRAWVSGEEVELTAKEHQLAMVLLANLGRPLSRTYLLDTIWGLSPDVHTRTLDVHVSRVRGKLGLRPEAGFLLTTIYGFGYRLELLDASQGSAASCSV